MASAGFFFSFLKSFFDFSAVAGVTGGKILFFGAEVDRGAFVRGNSVGVFEVKDRLAVAKVASCLNFFNGVGEFEEARGAFEEARLEVGPQTVTEDGNILI